MTESDEPLEDIAAGLLNGTMIFLLGAFVPGVLAWQMVAQWATWTADLRSVLVWDSLFDLGLLLVSLQIMRFGVRLLWRNAIALRKRRRAAPII